LPGECVVFNLVFHRSSNQSVINPDPFERINHLHQARAATVPSHDSHPHSHRKNKRRQSSSIQQ